jgi:hypothetical protein
VVPTSISCSDWLALRFFHPQIVGDVLDDVLQGRNLLRFVPEALAVVNAIDEERRPLRLSPR